MDMSEFGEAAPFLRKSEKELMMAQTVAFDGELQYRLGDSGQLTQIRVASIIYLGNAEQTRMQSPVVIAAFWGSWQPTLWSFFLQNYKKPLIVLKRSSLSTGTKNWLVLELRCICMVLIRERLLLHLCPFERKSSCTDVLIMQGFQWCEQMSPSAWFIHFIGKPVLGFSFSRVIFHKMHLHEIWGVVVRANMPATAMLCWE